MIFSLLVGSAVGCSDLCTCKNEMDEVRKKYGEPEEKYKYKSDEYRSETWYYHSEGRSYTFSWGGSECDCDKSIFTQERNSKPTTADNSHKPGSEWILVRRERIAGGECVMCPH
jgi:hypothetical protein